MEVLPQNVPQQVYREFFCVPLMGILGHKGGKVEGMIAVSSIL